MALEADRCQQLAEAAHHLGRDGFGTVAQQAHAGQIQALQVVRCEAIDDMLQAEVGRADDFGMMALDLAQPEQRIGDELGRFQLDLSHAAIQRHQMEGDQPHVVVIGHPAERGLRRQRTHGVGDLAHVAAQVAMRQAHPLGQPGRARGKLQIRQVVSRDRMLAGARSITGLRLIDQPAAAVRHRCGLATLIGRLLIGIHHQRRPAQHTRHAIELARHVRFAPP